MTVFTIGYEGLDIDTFLSLLAKHDIETIVDVRALPLSRKPGFSKKALENLLNVSGREYVHMAALGCPKPIRDRYRKDANWARYTEGFLSYLHTQTDAISVLCTHAALSKCALLCYEADASFCHRSMVANAVTNCSGADVTHIEATDVRTKPPGDRRLAAA